MPIGDSFKFIVSSWSTPSGVSNGTYNSACFSTFEVVVASFFFIVASHSCDNRQQ